MRKHLVLASLLFVISMSIAVPNAAGAPPAKPGEYASIVKHLKSKYRAKKVKIPFMWFARFAVSIVKPAGVKSFNVTLFEDLQLSRENVDSEMQAVMKRSFAGGEWSSILRARTAHGQQAYMYMRESGKNVKIALVTIDNKNAAVVRATFSPERLAEFMNDPKVFGISLSETGEAEKSAVAGEKAKKPE